jgi:4-oxalocrotonate tautomerase
MPFANIKVIEGVFSKEQKAKLIEKITEAMIEVEGESMRPLTWVVIEEVKSGDWAIGGKPVFPKAEGREPVAGRRPAVNN